MLKNHSGDSISHIGENGQRHRNGDHHLSPSGSMDLDIGFERKPARSRSNSKVYHPSVSPSMVKDDKPQNGAGIVMKPQSMQDQSTNNTHSRDQYTYIIRLSSLNETFDRKTLTIPVHPEALKLGRPNSSQKAPNIDNGYFDSKVISREQAELYVKNDQIYLRDKNSSNGTFLNTKKIVQEEVIKENDVIDLGIDIDSNQTKHQHHRKISCKVESIYIVPLNNGVSLPQILNNLNSQDKEEKQKEVSAFDAAFFGDVNSDLDDLALGMNHDFLSGIFVNNNIGTSSNLTKSVKILMNQLHQEKLNNIKLQSVERFLENYKNELSKNEQTAKIRQLKKDYSEQKKLNEAAQQQISQFQKKLTMIQEQMEKREKHLSEKDSHISELEQTLSKHNETVTKELNTKIKSHQANLKEKDVVIAKLKEEQQSIQTNFESNLKSLEDKISNDSLRYKELETKYQNLSRKTKSSNIKQDTYNLILISIGVLIIGLLILKVF